MYAAILSVVIIFPILLCFRVKKKKQLKVRQSILDGRFKEEYKTVKRKTKNQLILALIFFLLFALFCSLFIIGFCETVSSRVQTDWLTSSVVSLIMGMIVFELIPPLIVGCLAVFVYSCKAKCFLCIIIVIEALRAIGNTVAP